MPNSAQRTWLDGARQPLILSSAFHRELNEYISIFCRVSVWNNSSNHTVRLNVSLTEVAHGTNIRRLLADKTRWSLTNRNDPRGRTHCPAKNICWVHYSAELGNLFAEFHTRKICNQFVAVSFFSLGLSPYIDTCGLFYPWDDKMLATDQEPVLALPRWQTEGFEKKCNQVPERVEHKLSWW